MNASPIRGAILVALAAVLGFAFRSAGVAPSKIAIVAGDGSERLVEAFEIDEHIVEVVSDSGEGAQKCGQAFGSIAARMGIGIKTQVPNVFNGLSVRENLYLSARRHRSARRARRGRG